MLFIPGKPVIQFWIISISAEGIRTTIYLGSRLIMLVLGTSLLTFTTTPNELTDGLDKSLGFLNKVGVPVHEIAMMMSIALRFIPILTEELEKINEDNKSLLESLKEALKDKVVDVKYQTD